ncbi:MAG: hypothetical protein BZY82_03135 [SAR202 cluster bacterium Io17-Chloro-G3]|nr:MAG: hypothetical protein BZY82_03135 [SAR202 cluster bacterium Io17-Chloro-G3]
MKLVMFDDFRPGVLRDSYIVDVTSAVSSIQVSNPKRLMTAIIANFDSLRPVFERLSTEQEGVPITAVKLRAPNPRPPKILCGFANYFEPRTTFVGGALRPEAPPARGKRDPQDMFLKSIECVSGDGDIVELPPHQAVIFEHEAELGIVIAQRCKDLPATKVAEDVIFGYTGFVDISGRGLGPAGTNSRMGKSFNGFGPMGPCITTKDEIPNPNNLDIKFWVNDVLRQDYNTNTMQYPVPDILSFATSYMTLLPGDFLCCGTYHMDLGPLQDGDCALMELEKVGRFSFSVKDPLKRSWPAETRRQRAERETQADLPGDN